MLIDKEINAELLHKIEKFDESLKNRLPVLKNFRNVIKENVDNFENINQKMSSLMETLGQFEDIFLEYTKDVSLSQGEKSNPFSENFGSKFGIFKELQTEQNCPFYELDALVNSDIADYESFLEAIKTQKNFLTIRKSVR